MKKDQGKEKVSAIQIRFPVSLYRAIKARSEENRRSFNAEVVVSLDRFLGQISKEGQGSS